MLDSFESNQTIKASEAKLRTFKPRQCQHIPPNSHHSLGKSRLFSPICLAMDKLPSLCRLNFHAFGPLLWRQIWLWLRILFLPIFQDIPGRFNQIHFLNGGAFFVFFAGLLFWIHIFLVSIHLLNFPI